MKEKKGNYYDADVTEVASVAESEDIAAEEEAEARLLQQEAVAHIGEDDFLDLGFEDDEEVKPSTKSVEKLIKDPSLLSKNEKLKILSKESPELLQLIDEFKESVDQVRNQIQPILEKVSKRELITEDGMSYLEASSSQVEDHPVVDRLVEIRTILEKLKPVDQKLKYQIDKLLKKSVIGSAAVNAKDPLSYKANPNALLPRDEPSEKVVKRKLKAQPVEESDQEGSIEGDLLYKPPKLAAMPYVDEKDKERKSEEQNARRKSKLAKGRMTRELLDEFSERPSEEIMTHITSHGDVEQESDSEIERRKFEEEHFVRLEATKKKKKKRKLNEITDDFGEFGDMANITKGLSLPEGDATMGYGEDDEDLAEYLKTQVQKSKEKKSQKKARRSLHTEAEYPQEEEQISGKRGASYKMLKNKGLTGNRKHDIARVKHRNKFKKAQTKRRTSGTVKTAKPLEGAYSGESTGIKKRVVKSVKYNQ